MLEKIAGAVEQVITSIEEDREKQREIVRAKHAAYLEERHQKMATENRKALQEEWRKRAEARKKLLHEFTTIDEFRSIVESPQYERLSDKERDVFLQRADKLRKENPQFAADYKEWQNTRAKKVIASRNKATRPQQATTRRNTIEI